MYSKFVAFLLILGVAVAAQPAAAEETLKPFVLSYTAQGDMQAAVAEVKSKLQKGGFTIAGQYSPYPSATIIAVTSDALKSGVAQSDFGGYGAAQRVTVTEVNGSLQVAYTNPRYMAAAYRLADGLSGPAKRLQAALGRDKDYGPEDGMTGPDLRGYHYMFGMEYFDEPSVLNEADSYEAAVAAVEKGLASKTSGVSKVYRIDIPGKKETVFGVAMNGKGTDGGKMQDDAYIMSQIDFKDTRSTGHLPYEILVSGNKAYALYARFRIAINFPDLSMMGSNSFMSIMECPTNIERALTLAAGGKLDSQ